MIGHPESNQLQKPPAARPVTLALAGLGLGVYVLLAALALLTDKELGGWWYALLPLVPIAFALGGVALVRSVRSQGP